MSREEKLDKIKNFGSFTSIKWDSLLRNDSQDWINQRDPAFDSFTLTTTSKLMSVSITDATGKIIKEFNNFNLVTNTYTFDVSDLSEEIYFTTINTIDGSSIHKLLIKR